MATGCERPVLPGDSGGPVLPGGTSCSGGSPYESPRSHYSHSGAEHRESCCSERRRGWGRSTGTPPLERGRSTPVLALALAPGPV